MDSKPCRQFSGDDGEYIIEWQFNGCVLELEVTTAGVFEFMLTNATGEPQFTTLDFNKWYEGGK